MSVKNSTIAAQMSIRIIFLLMLPPPLQGSGWPPTVYGSALALIISHFSTNLKQNIGPSCKAQGGAFFMEANHTSQQYIDNKL